VHVARQLLSWGAYVSAKNLLLNVPVLLRLMEMRSHSYPSEEFLESFAPKIAGIVQAYSSVDDDGSSTFRLLPWVLMISILRLAQLQKLGKISKGGDKRKRWKGRLQLEPWMDTG
jgi:transcription factor IIIB subunit 2